MTETDVTIIGAGPAGMSAALFLAKKNISVTLIEKDTFPRDKICGDCLGGYAVSVIKQIDENLFDRFVHFDKKLEGSGVHFFGPDQQKISVKAVTIVEEKIREVVLCKRVDFDNFLMEEIKRYKHINIIQNTCVTNISKNSEGLLIQSKNQSLLKAKLVIVATGSIQTLVHSLNGKRNPRKHTIAGIRTYYEGIEGLNNEGFIELHFLKELAPGYLWIFPLPGNQANVGLGLRSDIIARKKINLRKILFDCINNHPYFHKRFQSARQISPIQGFPLASWGARRKISGNHYLLTGDAANLIEPLFGEGIGHAMYSGKFAADHAIQCIEKGNFSAAFNTQYDRMVYDKLGTTLRFSAMMQKIACYPGLISFLFNRVNKNTELQQMFFSIINGNTSKTRWKGLELIFRMILNFK
jgi:geranylgeranyl reductase family protein